MKWHKIHVNIYLKTKKTKNKRKQYRKTFTILINDTHKSARQWKNFWSNLLNLNLVLCANDKFSFGCFDFIEQIGILTLLKKNEERLLFATKPPSPLLSQPNIQRECFEFLVSILVKCSLYPNVSSIHALTLHYYSIHHFAKDLWRRFFISGLSLYSKISWLIKV